jgi:hypothetical protein
VLFEKLQISSSQRQKQRSKGSSSVVEYVFSHTGGPGFRAQHQKKENKKTSNNSTTKKTKVGKC